VLVLVRDAKAAEPEPFRRLDTIDVPAALDHAGGSVAAAARALGISRQALYQRIAKCGRGAAPPYPRRNQFSR
jgi:transcriptional regulator of acetoin/glycerol metabolism